MPAQATTTDWMQTRNKSSISGFSIETVLHTGVSNDTQSLSSRMGDDSILHDSVWNPTGLDAPGEEMNSMLHQVRRRGLHMSRKWCEDNTCSTGKKLAAMCNDTAAREKKTGDNRDKSQQRECEWCWDQSSQRPTPNTTQQAKLREHCGKVSGHAAFAVIAVSILLIVIIIVIAAILLARCIKRRQKARSDRNIVSEASLRTDPSDSGSVPNIRVTDGNDSTIVFQPENLPTDELAAHATTVA